MFELPLSTRTSGSPVGGIIGSGGLLYYHTSNRDYYSSVGSGTPGGYHAARSGMRSVRRGQVLGRWQSAGRQGKRVRAEWCVMAKREWEDNDENGVQSLRNE